MSDADDQLRDAKRRLLERVRKEIPDERVIRAMEEVPRESFVPDAVRYRAYEDVPQPIGEGQTISQPFIVALMVYALELKRSDSVLEVGTGSGYQAAIVASLARKVISVERIESLADAARERLSGLGYKNVRVVLAEKGLGWQKNAPYDAIIVAAGAPKLPRELMDQLAAGGRLIVPVGGLRSQELMKVTKSAESYAVTTLGACRFVPLIGEDAWPEGSEGYQEEFDV